jgi:hypothetical protein
VGDGDDTTGFALLFALAVEPELLLLDELPEPQADKMETAQISPAAAKELKTLPTFITNFSPSSFFHVN